MGLTKEEKKAKLEAKKQAKKEAEEGLRRKINYDFLAREIAAHNLVRDKINHLWRDKLLQIKQPVYRQQIEIMLHTLDRAYDKRDSLRDHIMYLRSVADMQYHRTIAHFCESSDRIITSFLQDIKNMCKGNNEKIAALLANGRVEVDYLIEYKKYAERHLQLLLYTNNEAANTKAWNTKGEIMVRKDEDTIMYLKLLDDVKYVLDGKYCVTWDEYKQTLKGYIQSTVEYQKEIRALRKKDQIISDVIVDQAKQIKMTENAIRRLRLEVIAYESGEKQASFRDRRKRHKDAYKSLKTHMTEGLKIDAKQLNTLVTATNNTMEWIEMAARKSEKILRMAALCRKLETQREKVVPYGSDIPHEAVKPNVHPATVDHWIVDALSTTTSGLTKLCQRIGKAELSKRALIHEKIKLERENALLLRELSKKTDDNFYPNTANCICKRKKTKQLHNKPVACDGNWEIKKLIR